MNADLHLYLTAARDVAREAADLIRRHQAEGVRVRTKGGEVRELVTTADEAADELIRARLLALFPHHAVMSEETAHAGATLDPETPTWIVDPLDGTSNFAHGLPIFSVSIGLWWQGQPLVAAVCEVTRDWLFWAAAGQGAWLNGHPLRVSAEKEPLHAVLASDWTHSPERRRLATHLFARFVLRGHAARSLGSAALGLCYVAAGWLDGYVNLGLDPWDAAAGVLLVQEAGGLATDARGQPWTPAQEILVATNGPLHATVLSWLEEVWEEEQ